ncbi:MAG: hypothetical protein Q9169_008011, partial [Polycauliona sp. 2 TL-2023]
MDAEVIAAIAALVVAFVAFLVASAQAVQQYLVSGQLIRLCDSVVYNQMPGQGHRIWQYSQFRFRVVYSIPQVHLLPDLWLDILSHVRPLPKEAAPLPSLRMQKSESTSAALAGEASWVSFVRAVQHSAGRSMRYVMVDGDADRCPSDLPVVPMQLSMRDIAVMSLSAGMQITDVSFQAQTISIQGDAGTITCSRHPILGSLIHFAQKQAMEDHGIQVLGGTIQGNWVARMLDIVSVAGHRYDSVDRKHYEEDEGSWMKATNKRPLSAAYEPMASQVDPPERTVRRRHPRKSPTAEVNDGDIVTEILPPLSFEKEASSMIRRSQDGDWAFVSETSEDIDIKITPRVASAPRNESLHQSHYAPNVYQYQPPPVRRRPTSRDDDSILPIQEPIGRLENEGIQSPQDTGYGIPEKIQSPHPQQAMTYSTVEDGDEPTGQTAVTYSTPVTYELQPEALTPHPDLHLTPNRYTGTLDNLQHVHRLGSQDQLGQEVTQSNLRPARFPLLLSDEMEGLVSPSQDKEALRDQARHEFVVDKWQQRFQERQKERSRGRSQHDRDRRKDSRRRPTRSSRSQDSLGSRQPARRRKLGVEERRRTSSSKLGGDDYSAHYLRARRHASSSSEHDRDIQSRSNYEDPRSRRRKSRSSSSSISPTMGSYERPGATYYTLEEPVGLAGYGGAPNPGRSDRTERDRQVGRKTFTVATGYAESNPVDVEDQMSNTSVERGRKRVRVLDPPQHDSALVSRKSSPRSYSRATQPDKPALRSPTERFPEDPDFVRPGVAATGRKDIPKDARWTKIRRDLIDPEVLDRGRERFEEKEDFIIVLRVLTREEIERYAVETQSLRTQRQQSRYNDDETGSKNSDNSRRSFVRQHEADNVNFSAGEDESRPLENPAQQDLSQIDPGKPVVDSARGRDRQHSLSAHEPDAEIATSYRGPNFRP